MHIDDLNTATDEELDSILDGALQHVYTAAIVSKMSRLTKVYLMGYSHGCGLMALAKGGDNG